MIKITFIEKKWQTAKGDSRKWNRIGFEEHSVGNVNVTFDLMPPVTPAIREGGARLKSYIFGTVPHPSVSHERANETGGNNGARQLRRLSSHASCIDATVGKMYLTCKALFVLPTRDVGCSTCISAPHHPIVLTHYKGHPHLHVSNFLKIFKLFKSQNRFQKMPILYFNPQLITR